MRKSFTLVELIVVISLFSVVFGTVLYFTIIARESWSLNTAQVSLQQDLRRVMARIADEIAESSAVQSPNGPFITDAGGNALNTEQRDGVNNILACVPAGTDCVYQTISFTVPTTRNNLGIITASSAPIVYTINANSITRQQGANPAETLISNVTFTFKAAGHGHAADPNAFGSGFELLASGRLKIIFAAQRLSMSGKNLPMAFETIVYLRN